VINLDNGRHPLAIAALTIALLLGVAGDLLVRGTPWGINVMIGVALFLAAVIMLLSRVGRTDVASIALAAIPALAATIGIAWRDSPVLVAIDTLTLIAFLSLLALGPRGIRVATASVSDVAVAMVITALQTCAGMLQLPLFDVRWRTLPLGVGGRRAVITLRGTVMALPALVIFGALLASADAKFSALMDMLFRFDLPTVLGHIALTLIIAVLCAGVFRSLLWGGPAPHMTKPGLLRLPAAELTVALGLVDALFLTFVIVQSGYFFGNVTPSFRYAQYARRGFFELVMVVILVVPLLLVTEWLIDKAHPRLLRAFRLLAALQVLLVITIAASALHRMSLYQQAYGWTQLRLYTSAFTCWLIVVLAWLSLTVLTGYRTRFLTGLLTSAIVALVVLHAVDPDDCIVRTNIANARAGRRPLDTSYATSLSADATPALIENLDALEPTARPCAARHLLAVDARWGDWRSWNMSRASARDAVQHRRPELENLAAACGKR
jgi:hypothetical protein